MKTELMKWVESHRLERMKVLEALKVGTFDQLKNRGLTMYVLTDKSGEGVSFGLHITCAEFIRGILKVHLSHKPTFKAVGRLQGKAESWHMFCVDKLEFYLNTGWCAVCSVQVRSGEFVPFRTLVDSIHVELGHVYGDGRGGD